MLAGRFACDFELLTRSSEQCASDQAYCSCSRLGSSGRLRMWFRQFAVVVATGELMHAADQEAGCSCIAMYAQALGSWAPDRICSALRP